MGDNNINDILSSIITAKTDDAAMDSKWDPASIQRLLNDLMAMSHEQYALKFRKEIRKQGQGIRVVFYADQGHWGQTEPNEEDMIEVQAWCTEANCGKRLSFDTFYFKNEEAYLMFALRWQ
jgi:hypothetical protein